MADFKPEDVKPQKSLEETSTWAVAVVCFVLLFISIVLEHSLHKLGEWFKKKHKKTLFEALEKVKAELMLLGFISLLLTIAQAPISQICINKNVASTMHPCSLEQAAEKIKNKNETKLPKYIDTCGDGKVAFVSAYGIHQLHIFIFVLAVVHVIYCIVTYALGKSKMKIWTKWEEETKTIEYQYTNDPERIRFARDTTFGRRHLSFWSKNSFTLWIVCFFRQFFGSVTKVDYLALRHGFIMAHMPTANEAKYDFHKYIHRSLEKDFKTVVEISPVIWFVAVLFLLTNANGLYSYLWLPFIPLVVLLVVGTKLEVTITKLGVRIQERGDVVRGAPVVQPGDDLFWFDSPGFILFLIHLVLFTNAFQLAFFVWSTYEYKLKNCFHQRTEDVIIRIVVGVVVQILCSYVTLPLYALVTQMGSKMKKEVFDEKVATALKHWHDTAKSETKHGRHTESNTPFSSRPNTPPHGSSPIHLLHNFKHRSGESSDHQSWDPESQHQEEVGTSSHHSLAHASSEPEPVLQSVQLGPTKSSKSLRDFSFK